MSESYIKIGADGLDVDEIVRQIRERADARRKSGEFDMEAVMRAERFNLSAVKDDADFFDRYISCLRLVSQVDINDFEIVEHRARFASLLRKFKKGIWSALKFYTYHLWSQQNQVNNLFNAAIELVAERDSEQLRKMQSRIDELEARLAKLEAK
ncbi:MAG: hypothetical protein IJQ73_03170 [Kiritimatiellae bacterium]|nr:hypothetical protein [Kiritimatiellia bacterium]